METIKKISETEFEKVIPQPDLVVTKTLDELLAEQVSLEQGIQNNKDAIIFQTTKLNEVLKDIETVKGLGIKTQIEVVPKTPVEINP